MQNEDDSTVKENQITKDGVEYFSYGGEQSFGRVKIISTRKKIKINVRAPLCSGRRIQNILPLQEVMRAL